MVTSDLITKTNLNDMKTNEAPPLISMPGICLSVVLGVLVLLLFSCGTTKNKQDILRIALVQYSDSPLSEDSKKGFEDGFSQAGMTAGKDYAMKVYNAQGDIGTLNLIFDAVLNQKPGLVLVTSTPTLQVAIKKIKDIPVVFSVVADPFIAGAGKSFEDHLPNVTGISTLGGFKEMVGLIKELFPEIKKTGTLFTPGEINSVKNMSELKKYSEDEGIELITVPVNSSAETTDAILSLISKQPSVICQIIDNLTSVSAPAIIKVCQEHNIPYFGFVSDQAEKGAVLVFSRDFYQAGIDGARLAKKIIDGTNPADIPFEFVSKTNLIINQSAAARFNIAIPEELMKREDVTILK
jgi:ABC-type uncharacterized transport system substrate-binding protein